MTLNAIISSGLFLIVYGLVASELVDQAVITFIGVGIAMALHLITFEEAASAVDLNVIFLLIGMMISVHMLSRTGFFEYLAMSIAKKVRANAMSILILFLLITAIMSALLDNVTTIILIVPMTILICELLEIAVIPFVILEALFSNIGGTATLIGDPPNIVIGSSVGLSFNDFLINLAPTIIAIIIFALLAVYIIFRKKIIVAENVKSRIMQSIPKLAIVDKKNMIRSLIIMGAVIISFTLHSIIKIESGMIAMLGGMVMLLVCKHDEGEILGKAEWNVIMFFIGMFMLIATLQVNGVIDMLGTGLISIVNGNLFMLALSILWGSALFSTLVNNIPFVITMVPLLQSVQEQLNLSGNHEFDIIWWALALGACLGGNGTLIGASANIVMAGISKRNNYTISFKKFFTYGIPITILALSICTIYIYIRFL